MAETKIDTPRSGELRTARVGAQSLASAKTAGAAGDEAPGFSSLLAALDGFAATGLQQLVPGEEPEEKTAPQVLAAPELQPGALLHAPWMSLVGQTQRLDTQGDADLRQGVAADFLSGRGSATLLAHRQALEVGGADAGAGAHAAFMAKDLPQNLQKTQDSQAPAAINSVSDATPTQDPDKSPLAAERNQQGLQQLAGSEQPAPRAESLAPRVQAQAESGISLQGMSAVQPQALEGLKDLLRATRSAQAEGAAADRPAAASGGHELLTAAAALGGAMGAAGGGMQGQGQDASGLAQAAQYAAPTEREQEVSEQVAFWVHQKTQNAALSIQHEGKPIQVQVQLNGQEAHVRFASDDPQSRQLLAEGQTQLRELLQDQGLNLAGVSVDAGSAQQQGAGGNQPEERGTAKMARVSVSAAELSGTEPRARAPQVGVDLFV
ncbi:flagellar hook-length control protein FliK [Comamonas guangdongensis]|uniref:Flagellar hook-length control protein FliK n=1 Tax=Comamonas guangdongensis TaxID=510515 RepID=A0ABV3ZRD2_9BURK